MGVVGRRYSGLQTKSVFCIGWFRSILINQQKQRRGGKVLLYRKRGGFIDWSGVL